jgi:hypothetical protein
MAASRFPLRQALDTPLLRFFALGALIFALFAAFDDRPAGPRDDVIALDREEARRLVARFEAARGRPASAGEVERLMRDWAVAEAFVREARALGLDRGDEVVRQRLLQKMSFFAESRGRTVEPDEAALRAHFEAHPDRFAIPPALSFEQIFLGESPPPQAAEAAREALAAGARPAPPQAAPRMPESLRLATRVTVDGVFGDGFFARLAALEPGAWRGPVASGFGAHLVRVVGRQPARTPPFDAVRRRVEQDWRARRAEELRAAFAEDLLERYDVATPDPAAVLGR